MSLGVRIKDSKTRFLKSRDADVKCSSLLKHYKQNSESELP